MTTVHVMTGLPASGKTTAARELVAAAGGRCRRVSLDDLRAMFDPGSEGRGWSRAAERSVLAVQDASVRETIAAGFDVVVDNTHLTPRVPGRLKAAVAGRARFVVHDFTGVPLQECLRRDAARARPVGDAVIRRLAARHARAVRAGWRLTAAWLEDTAALAGAEPYTPGASLPSAVLCDIDGTLALGAHRHPYDFTRCGQDGLNGPVRDALIAFRQTHGDRIVLLSGRSEDFRAVTRAWLATHEVPYDELWMRPSGDLRRDDVVKAELFDAYVRHRYRVRVGLDDRDRVVAVWRRLGLPAWQVAPGAF